MIRRPMRRLLSLLLIVCCLSAGIEFAADYEEVLAHASHETHAPWDDGMHANGDDVTAASVTDHFPDGAPEHDCDPCHLGGIHLTAIPLGALPLHAAAGTAPGLHRLDLRADITSVPLNPPPIA